jgi:hypothetical protein
MERPTRYCGGVASAQAGNPKTFQMVMLTAFQPGDGRAESPGVIGGSV